MQRSIPVLALLLLSACGLFSSPEGHYTIDRKLTSAAIDSYARSELLKIKTQMSGKNAQVSDDELKAVKEETISGLDQVAIDIILDPGGKFHGSSTLEGKTETHEGTWALHGEELEITETGENGQPLEKPKIEKLIYHSGHLTYTDESTPFIVLSKQ